MSNWETRNKRRYRVTILRTDGTPWVHPDLAKHVLFRPHAEMVEIYFGEHNADRKLMLVPYLHIDHIYIEEVNTD